ncbi:MAG: hemin receptor [Rhodoblastus sp.]|nr:hemin receptor [Rhodoblastus sp.]
MTRDQAQIVEDSFSAIGPVTLEMGEAFYDNLFEIAPELRKMFSRETSGQAMRFSQILAFVVSNLRAPDRLLPIIRNLGARHREVGVVAEHFPPFKAALLKTVHEKMGDHWTPEVESAWSSTYDMLAKEMLSA